MWCSSFLTFSLDCSLLLVEMESSSSEHEAILGLGVTTLNADVVEGDTDVGKDVPELVEEATEVSP